MSNRNESYLATSTTKLNADFWNAVIRDVSARISTLEGLKAEVEALTNLARDLAVQRVNVALAEYVTMIQGVAEIGAIQTVLATGSASIGPGTKTITVQLQDRDLIGTTGYVVVRPQNSAEARMAGPIVGYSAATGQLQFEVVNAVGDGTENAWVVGYAKTVVVGPTGPAPQHEWAGTSLRFQNPDGSWADAVNLKGGKGDDGVVDESTRASQGEAEAGSDNAKWMSPLRVAQAIAAAVPTIVSNVVDGAPGALDTLNELAAALGDDANFAATVTNALAQKLEEVAYADIVAGALASAADWRAKTASKLLTTAVWDAAAAVALSDASTIAWDMSAGINFAVSVAGNRTLGNPTNVLSGKMGRIKVTASGATRTLAKASNLKSSDAITWPVEIPSGASAYVYYDCEDASNVIIAGVVLNPT